MKKFTLSVATILAMSASVMAGGDIAPVEPIVEVVVADESGFYVGIAYGYADINDDFDGFDLDDSWSGNHDDNFDTIMFQAGYKINKYFAVEGRYWDSFGDGDFSANWGYTSGGTDNAIPSDSDFSAWGIYVKPMYPVTEEFDIYALLGYGNANLDTSGDKWHSLDDEGFQWGLGGSYEFTDNFAVFVDYVSLYNDDISVSDTFESENHDYEIYTVNVGVTYKF